MGHGKTIRWDAIQTLALGCSLVGVALSQAGCNRQTDEGKNAIASVSLPSVSHQSAVTTSPAPADERREQLLLAKQVVVAGDHSYILTLQGSVLAMGGNEFGAIGLAKDIKQTSAPTRLAGVDAVLQIASGTWHACAVTADQRVVCWGRNFGGAIGNGSVKNEYFVPPTEVVGLAQVAEVGAAGTHSCARLIDGTARCWGCVISGTVERPQVLQKLSRATSLALAPESSCSRLEDGRVACWDVLLGKDFDYGDAITGGDGNVKPVSAVPKLQNVKQITVSPTHACALTDAGLVLCWGKGSEGELGNGRSGEGYRVMLPAEVSDLRDVQAVAAGTGYTCAVHRQGEVSCWGQNGHGQLGLGDKRLRVRPERLPNLTGVAAVALGTSHSCAILGTGEVYCWGRNHRGQVGQSPVGSADVRTTPTRVTW